MHFLFTDKPMVNSSFFFQMNSKMSFKTEIEPAPTVTFGPWPILIMHRREAGLVTNLAGQHILHRPPYLEIKDSLAGQANTGSH